MERKGRPAEERATGAELNKTIVPAEEVAGVLTAGDAVFMARLKSFGAESSPSRWLFPGGAVRFGEKHEDALAAIYAHDFCHRGGDPAAAAPLRYPFRIEAVSIIGQACYDRARERRIELVRIVWVHVVPGRGVPWRSIQPLKKWDAVQWVGRHEVRQHLSAHDRSLVDQSNRMRDFLYG